MKRLISGLGLIAFATQARAQLFYEPFDMPVGTLNGNVNAMTGHGYTLVNGTIDMNVAATNLAPASGLSQPIGANSVQLAGGPGAPATADRTDLGFFSSGDMYYSLTLKVNDISGANTVNGAFCAGFSPLSSSFTDNVTFAGARLILRKSPTDATKFNVGIRNDVNSAGNSPIVFDTTPRDPAQSVFLVVRYRFNPNSQSDDEAGLWVNPSPTTFGAPQQPPPDFTTSGADTFDAVSPDLLPGLTPFFQSVFLRQNAAGPTSYNLDDIRIDRNWAQVTLPTGVTWSGAGNGSWSNAANWSGTVPDTAGAFVTLDDTSASHSITVDGTRTIGTMTIKTVQSYSIGGSTIIFDGGAGSTAHGTSAIHLLATRDASGSFLNGSANISSKIQLNNDLETDVGVGQTLALQASISGSGGITKNGAGLLALTGSNSYTGNTIVNDGTLVLNLGTALGATSNSLILNSGIVFDVVNTAGGRNIAVTPAGGTFSTVGNATFGNLTVGTNSVAVSTFHKDQPGRLLLNSMRGGAVEIDGGQIRINGARDTSRTSVLNALTIAGSTDNWTASLDLNQNDLILNYSDASPLDTIANQIKNGYANGAWNGNGITSNAASLAPHRTGLGYADAAAIGVAGGTFSGQAVGANAVVVRYTYAGDGNLDGQVNTVDFNVLAANFNSTAKAWVNGDFNYDGIVNALDFNAIATNFGATPITGSPLGTPVPEPMSALMVCASLLLSRKRFSRNRS
jgi:autotransporter-associated beta strand protein